VLDPATRDAFRRLVRERTAPAQVALVPEITTYQASELTPLWHATSAQLAHYDPNPFWCFPWAGGQALARHLLDQGSLVKGRRVLDLATGSGLVALAAARAGAAQVVAADVSPYCEVVVPMNAALNGVEVMVRIEDLLDTRLKGFDLVVAGDVFYEQPLAERALRWLRTAVADGVQALVGDPGRAYSPRTGVAELAVYEVPVSREIEDRPVMRTRVLEILPWEARHLTAPP
jgi:predicted nicotinamide N-methyase